MATWHQQKNAVPLYHETQWTVVIDPPNQMRGLMRFSSQELADMYMRNLQEHNPGAARGSYVLKPAKG